MDFFCTNVIQEKKSISVCMELLLTTTSDWIKTQSKWKTPLYHVPHKGMLPVEMTCSCSVYYLLK